MSADRISWKGTTDGHSTASTFLHSPGDVAMIVRGRPRALLMLCPCGCGDVLTINLDARSDKAWVFYRRNAGISVYPSVWRTTGCKSHFVIWNDGIFGLGLDWWDTIKTVELHPQRVLELFPNKLPVHFTKIAEQLDAVPWEVLSICRQLAKEKKLLAGSHDEEGYFCRPSDQQPGK